MKSLRNHERVALEALLDSEEPVLRQLRDQARQATVVNRTYTTFGEYVDLSIPDACQSVLPPELILGDIDLQVQGVQFGVTTLLYVVAGRLSYIEFATVSDDWPEEPQVTGVRYLRETETAPGTYALEPVPLRDSATIRRALLGRGAGSAS